MSLRTWALEPENRSISNPNINIHVILDKSLRLDSESLVNKVIVRMK